MNIEGGEEGRGGGKEEIYYSTNRKKAIVYALRRRPPRPWSMTRRMSWPVAAETVTRATRPSMAMRPVGGRGIKGGESK